MGRNECWVCMAHEQCVAKLRFTRIARIRSARINSRRGELRRYERSQSDRIWGSARRFASRRARLGFGVGCFTWITQSDGSHDAVVWPRQSNGLYPVECRGAQLWHAGGDGARRVGLRRNGQRDAC